MGKDAADTVVSALDDMSDQAVRLSELVDRYLELSKEQENKLDFAPLSVADLFVKAETVTAPLLRKNGNRLEIITAETLPRISGVEGMLLQILQNLIDNANRHSQNSVITLSAAAAPEGMVEIRVADHGKGIAENIKHNVFIRGISGGEGSGLGLAICKEIVETHGGLINISSGKSKGTQVWFTVPSAEGGGE